MPESEPSERAIIRQHSKSFALAARLLSPVVRCHAERLYAWCRYADDAIDHASTPVAAVVALNELRAELDAIYTGRMPSTTAGQMLKTFAEDIHLPGEYLDELLRGMEMDAAGQRYKTFDELLLYCHRVAGVVGLMMCHAMGVAGDSAAIHAGHLGIAMQLTNIARDVAEDWARGRLYLPTDWLGGTPPAGQPLEDSVVVPVISRLLDEADRYYQSGDIGLQSLDRRSRLAVRTARMVYSAIGTEVRRNGCRPSAGRSVTSKATKVRAAVVAAWKTWSEPRRSMAIAAPSTVFGFHPLTGLEQSSFSLSSRDSPMNGSRDSMSTVMFGLALVLVMATVLFVLVGLNPKNDEYSTLPWLYSGACAAGRVACWVISVRLGRQLNTK